MKFKKSIIFIFFFSCLNLLFGLFFIYNEKQTTIQYIANDLYTINSLELSEEQFLEYEKYFNDDIRVFLEFNERIRLIYKQSKNWNEKVTYGRFFEENEEGYKAVVGSDYIENLKQKNSKKYITMFGIDFEVIGIMQEKFPSKLDSLVMLKCDNISEINMKSIIIDSDKKSAIYDFKRKVKSKNPNEKIIKRDNALLNNKIQSDFFNKLTSITILLSILFGNIFLSTFYFELSKDYFKVQVILGIKFRSIVLEVNKTMINNMIVSTIILFILGINLTHILLVFMLNLIINYLTIIILMKYWIKKKYQLRGNRC